MATSAHSRPTWVRSLSIPTARVPLRMQLPACTLQPLFLTAGQSCLAFKRTPGLPPSSTSRSNSARKIVSLNRSWEAPGPVGNFKVSGTLGGKTVTVPIERAVDQMLCRELDEKFTRCSALCFYRPRGLQFRRDADRSEFYFQRAHL